MAIKKPSQAASNPDITSEQADTLAGQLADKPYGKNKSGSPKILGGGIARTTISLPKSLSEEIEDLAMRNKRQNKEPKNVSAIVRAALEIYLK